MNDMERIKELLAELKPLMGSENAAERARMDEIVAELQPYADDEEVRKVLTEFVQAGLEEVNEEIVTLKQQYGDTYELLPLSYIAQHYFGKSRAWLYQRLNGYKVRGKVYRLNESEKQTFNRAIREVAQRIGSVQLV